MRVGRSPIVAAVLAVAVGLIVVGPARAAAPLPTGQAQGVKVVWKKGGQVIVFGKRAAGLYKRIAGRQTIVACWHISDGGRDGGDNPVRAPKRGRTLKTGDGVRDWDYCRIWLPAREVTRRDVTTHYPRRLIVSIPLSQKGAIYLDEHTKALGLRMLLIWARSGDDLPPTGPYRAPANLVDRLGGVLRVPWFWPGRHPVVALTTPEQTPPAGALGYYSDAAEHAAAVTLSASGRRLFIEFEPDDVLHTNVVDYAFDEDFE